jgi:hypothetical protein
LVPSETYLKCYNKWIFESLKFGAPNPVRVDLLQTYAPQMVMVEPDIAYVNLYSINKMQIHVPQHYK